MSTPAEGSRETPGRRGRVSLWSTRLRWFGAEFLVVVTGVLVALGVQAWYESGQNRGPSSAVRTYAAADPASAARYAKGSSST
jgi:hypothetical protein